MFHAARTSNASVPKRSNNIFFFEFRLGPSRPNIPLTTSIKQRFKISPLVFFLFSYRPPHIPAIVSGAHVSALYDTAVREAPTTQPRGSSQPVGLTSPGCTRHTALPTVPRASVVPDLSHEMLRGCPTPTPLLDTSTVSSSWSGESPAPTTPGKIQRSNDPKIQRSKDPKIQRSTPLASEAQPLLGACSAATWYGYVPESILSEIYICLCPIRGCAPGSTRLPFLFLRNNACRERRICTTFSGLAWLRVISP